MAGDDAEIISKPGATVSTPDELLRERGLDPAEWEMVDLTVKEWDMMTSDKATGDNRRMPMKQLICRYKRLVPLSLIFPARVPGDYIRPRPLRIMHADREDNRIRKIVFVGDQQVPKHDKRLHQLFLEWLEYNKPDEGVWMGDSLDFPTISKYLENPEWDEPVQRCVDEGYMIKREAVQASEETDWVMLEGNHDARLRDAILAKLPALHGLRRAKVPGRPVEPSVFSIENLLRLDELGIKYIHPNGDYDHAQYVVNSLLAVRHGNKVKQKAGETVLASSIHLNHGLIMGHTHRQAVVNKTIYGVDGKPINIASAETGCMCEIEGGLGYATDVQWTNGFIAATVWPNGRYHLELATYYDGALLYRDQRFK
jgi:UDP-2,3-diacylglucosamine pyrophosphatase LpxH